VKRAEQLTREELQSIVNAVQDLLFLDLVDDRDVYTVNKALDLADTVHAIGALYERHGLVPGVGSEPAEHGKEGLFVVFSLATHDLAHGHALSYEEAADIADRLSDSYLVKVWDGEKSEEDGAAFPETDRNEIDT